VLPRALVGLLKLVVHGRGSMIIAGPPGSGKTTLLRSILYYLVPKTWKVIVIEDTGDRPSVGVAVDTLHYIRA